MTAPLAAAAALDGIAVLRICDSDEHRRQALARPRTVTSACPIAPTCRHVMTCGMLADDAPSSVMVRTRLRTTWLAAVDDRNPTTTVSKLADKIFCPELCRISAVMTDMALSMAPSAHELPSCLDAIQPRRFVTTR